MGDKIGDQPAEFDAFAHSYDVDLAKGLSLTGENKEYFAQERIDWLKSCLLKINAPVPSRVLDFGCGDGGSIDFLDRGFSPEEIVGVDISAESLSIAQQKHTLNQSARFHLIDEFGPKEHFDLAFCNGVFHHILPPDRIQAIEYIFNSLRPGGYFAFWENNPWNPGTRFLMSRVPFDRDAIMLSSIESKRLLKKIGFNIIRTDFLFIFPHILRKLRFIEPSLSQLPFGGQYLVLGQKSN